MTPVYRGNLDPDEKLALLSIARHLPDDHHFTLAPRSLDMRRLKLPLRTTVKRFPDKYFTGQASYNRLLLSRRFYEAFADYEFMLIVQLDALVLSNRLQEWCAAGWDYIGAPWFEGFRDAKSRTLMGVGNGGFSLRKIPSLIRILEMKRPAVFDEPIGLAKWWRRRPIQRLAALWSCGSSPTNAVPWEAYLARFFVGNEDNFWGIIAPAIDQQFHVPPARVGLDFAFELNPRHCYEQNNGQLPFGCHAWAKRDRAFWEEMGVVPPRTSSN